MLDKQFDKESTFEAVVLAGGFGTRLASVVSDVPKPMAPVAHRPFMEWILDLLIEKGCKRVVIAVGHLAEVIISHFGNSYKGIEIIYSKEVHPLGTGGAIKQALSFCKDDSVVVLNGDTLFDVDLFKLISLLEDKQCNLALALRRVDDSSRYGSAEVLDGYVVKFGEKGTSGAGFITGGIYAMKRNLLDCMPEVFSFETDFEEQYVQNNFVAACRNDGFFIDIGIPEEYQRAQIEFNKGYRKAAFFDRDGTINVDTGHLFEIDKLQFIPGSPELIKKHNNQGDYVVVVTNQAGIAKGLYSEKEMHMLHTELNRRLRKGWDAHIDAFHFCPHHPDFTGECNCRKPKPGLINEAAQIHSIDLGKSVMYGDKETDELAAKHAGVGRFIYINQSMKG